MPFPWLASLSLKTLDHLSKYDKQGKELFLQTLRLMREEMKVRYDRVDATLDRKLAEIEIIAQYELNK